MDILNTLSTLYADPFVHRCILLLVYGLLAKGVHLFLDKVLKRLLLMTKAEGDEQVLAILHWPIIYTVLGLGLLHAVTVSPQLPMPWNQFLPAAIKSLLLLVWSYAVLGLFGYIAESYIEAALSRGKIGRDLFLLLKNVVRVIIIASALLWLLSIWNVSLAPLFASAGIAGIAIALAAKDTLANFFGGISIFADRTFSVGDYIILDNTDRGEVVEIGIRSTRIKTRDDILITIPNSILANSKIINESAPIPRFRIRVPVGVAYGSDLDLVEEILLKAAHENPAVVDDPAPRVRMRAFGASSVDFQLLCWVEKPSVKGLEMHNLLKEIYRLFAENDITIPFPQQDVYIKEYPKDEL